MRRNEVQVVQLQLGLLLRPVVLHESGLNGLHETLLSRDRCAQRKVLLNIVPVDNSHRVGVALDVLQQVLVFLLCPPPPTHFFLYWCRLLHRMELFQAGDALGLGERQHRCHVVPIDLLCLQVLILFNITQEGIVVLSIPHQHRGHRQLRPLCLRQRVAQLVCAE